MLSSQFKIVVSAMVVALIATMAMAAPAMGHKGQIGTIRSQSDFCLWLPPHKGENIARSEDHAVAYCTHPNKKYSPGAKKMPAGFIKSAHFIKNSKKDYVQVTGRINRSKYGLSPKDGGGQYDLKAPRGSWCTGYNSFVQLIEPDAQIYCIRCCKNKKDCPTNKSTHGCKKVLGGNYS
ncbi:hypothetical protein BGX28_005624 [Mortierella sp. GBA30]|nr:hypothetical protein BGX28_005624 [Mortierella sp. GBA30]